MQTKRYAALASMTLLALAFGAAACGGAATDSCLAAVQHVNSCVGAEVLTTARQCDASRAEDVLAQGCDEIQKTGTRGKSDTSFWDDFLVKAERSSQGVWGCKPRWACPDDFGSGSYNRRYGGWGGYYR